MFPRWTILAFFAPISLFASDWNPQSSGPFFTGTADTTPPGSFFAEAYAYYGVQPNSNSLSIPMRFDQGIVPSVEFNVSVPYQHTWVKGPNGLSGSGGGVGDSQIFFKFRILEEKAVRPSLAIETTLTLPSGNATNLDPTKNGADQTGQGSLAETLTLLARKKLQPFKIYGQLSYTRAATVQMQPGYSLTNLNSLAPGQTVVPGDNLYLSLAFEHILNDSSCFGYLFELYGNHVFQTNLLSGNASTMSWTQVSVAPELEINSSDSIQWAAGMTFPFASVNGPPRNMTYMLTVTWQYDGPLGHR
jgi:hypothetical protein